MADEQQSRVKPDEAAYDPGKAPRPKDTFDPATHGGDLTGSDQADADIIPEGKMGVSGDKVPVRTEFVPDSGPFVAHGSQVRDSGGRVVAIIGGGHMNQSHREALAGWVAKKLSA